MSSNINKLLDIFNSSNDEKFFIKNGLIVNPIGCTVNIREFVLYADKELCEYVEKYGMDNYLSFALKAAKEYDNFKKVDYALPKDKAIFNNNFILLSDLAKSLGSYVGAIYKVCQELGINVSIEVINFKEYKAILNIESHIDKISEHLRFGNCKGCGTKFKKTKKHRLYCCNKCRNKVNQNNFRSGKAKKRTERSLTYKELSKCSTDCLLKEFGDIE